MTGRSNPAPTGEDAPIQLPDSVSRCRPRLFQLKPRLPESRWRAAVLPIALSLLLSACNASLPVPETRVNPAVGLGPTPIPSPTAPPSPTPSPLGPATSPTTGEYRNARAGYRVERPAGWRVDDADPLLVTLSAPDNAAAATLDVALSGVERSPEALHNRARATLERLFGPTVQSQPAEPPPELAKDQRGAGLVYSASLSGQWVTGTAAYRIEWTGVAYGFISRLRDGADRASVTLVDRLRQGWETTPHPALDRSYAAPDRAYSIAYPADWVVASADPSFVVLRSPNRVVQVAIDLAAIAATQSPEALRNRARDRLTAWIGPFVQATPAEPPGGGGASVSYRAQGGAGEDWSGLAVYLQDPRRLYGYLVRVETWALDSASPTVEAIVGSLKIGG